MYKELDATTIKKILELPEDYRVDAFLSFGHWDTEKISKMVEVSLSSLEIVYEAKRLPGFLGNILELKIDNKTYWFAVVYGGAILSEYLHFACVFGSQKNIHIGSYGGLNKEINSADLIIPTYSYGDESITRMYEREVVDNKHYSNKNLSESIKTKLNKELKLYEGPIVTLQGMMAETKEDVDKWSNEGYYGVEMETATVFAVSKHFKVPSSALVYVSDNLIKGQVVGDDQHISEQELRDKAKNEMFRVAILELLNR